MKRGNLNRDGTVFSWMEGGMRKSHRLGKKDVLISVSITGSEFVVHQKQRPDQFVVMSDREIRGFLLLKKKQNVSIYIQKDAFDVLQAMLDAKFLVSLELNVVFPANTRRKTQGSSSSTQSPPASETRPPPASETSSTSNTRFIPEGLYEWTGKRGKSLTDIICDDSTRTSYLEQATRNVCDRKSFQTLTGGVGKCERGEHIQRCVRRLLRNLHPDKLNDSLKACGQEMYKELSGANAEMKLRPRYDEKQCS